MRTLLALAALALTVSVASAQTVSTTRPDSFVEPAVAGGGGTSFPEPSTSTVRSDSFKEVGPGPSAVIAPAYPSTKRSDNM